MPKKTITKLYAEFEKALAAMEALPYPLRETREKEYDAALALASDLADRIVNTRANPEDPIAEMLMKIAARVVQRHVGTARSVDVVPRRGHRGLRGVAARGSAGDAGRTAAPRETHGHAKTGGRPGRAKLITVTLRNRSARRTLSRRVAGRGGGVASKDTASDRPPKLQLVLPSR